MPSPSEPTIDPVPGAGHGAAPDVGPPRAVVRPAAPETLLRRLRRTAAGLAAASALLHLLMVAGSAAPSDLLMLAMAGLCLPCAVHLARRATRRVWATVGLMNAGMVGLHVWMLGPSGGHAEHAAEHAGEPGAGHGAELGAAHGGEHVAGTAAELLMVSATAAALVEVVLAAAGVLLLTVRRPGAAGR